MRLLWLAAAFSTLAVAEVELSACSEDAPDHLHITRLRLAPDRVLPGDRLCVHFDAAPTAPLRHGARVRVELPGVITGGADYELCTAGRVDCPSAGNVSATICDTVPLAAMLLGGKGVPFALRASDEAGAPTSCVRGVAPVADAVNLDIDVESMADASAHHPLRKAIVTAEGARSGLAGGKAAAEARVERVRKLLREAYEASPDWAEAFARWREQHGRRYLREGAHDPAHESQAVLAEAKGFDQFRQNVMSAHRQGRGLSIDERADQNPDARRTLGHFA